MKKILSMIMAGALLLAATLVPVSAKISISQYWEQTLFSLEDDDTIYSAIRYDSSENVRTYEFTYWIEQMGYLEDIAEYTEAYGEELTAKYAEYVKEKRAAVLAEGEAFFEKYFDASTDELVCNSDQRALVLVKSTVANAKNLEDKEDCTLFFAYDEREYSISRFEDNDFSVLTPPDYVLEMDPYEIVYAMDFYKDAQEPRYWDAMEWEISSYMYSHLYSHYPATSEEATPDYVLAFAGENVASPAYSAAGFGDKYLVQAYNIYYPYTLGMHIITTNDMKVHTLREAWNAQIDGIEDVFEDYGLGEIRGDSDHDGEITIKDATYIQKCIAGILTFTEDEYATGFGEPGYTNEDGFFEDRVSDMNMDKVVNIKDATAIQKAVAGLEYK